jgi:hypothetical protein
MEDFIKNLDFAFSLTDRDYAVTAIGEIDKIVYMYTTDPKDIIKTASNLAMMSAIHRFWEIEHISRCFMWLCRNGDYDKKFNTKEYVTYQSDIDTCFFMLKYVRRELEECLEGFDDSLMDRLKPEGLGEITQITQTGYRRTLRSRFRHRCGILSKYLKLTSLVFNLDTAITVSHADLKRLLGMNTFQVNWLRDEFYHQFWDSTVHGYPGSPYPFTGINLINFDEYTSTVLRHGSCAGDKHEFIFKSWFGWEDLSAFIDSVDDKVDKNVIRDKIGTHINWYRLRELDGSSSYEGYEAYRDEGHVTRCGHHNCWQDNREDWRRKEKMLKSALQPT